MLWVTTIISIVVWIVVIGMFVFEFFHSLARHRKLFEQTFTPNPENYLFPDFLARHPNISSCGTSDDSNTQTTHTPDSLACSEYIGDPFAGICELNTEAKETPSVF